MGARVTTSETKPTDIVKEIGSIYARWRAGEISQEDALFAIGDCLEGAPPGPVEDPEPKHRR